MFTSCDWVWQRGGGRTTLAGVINVTLHFSFFLSLLLQGCMYNSYLSTSSCAPYNNTLTPLLATQIFDLFSVIYSRDSKGGNSIIIIEFDFLFRVKKNLVIGQNLLQKKTLCTDDVVKLIQQNNWIYIYQSNLATCSKFLYILEVLKQYCLKDFIRYILTETRHSISGCH